MLYDHAALKIDAACSPSQREFDRIADRVRTVIGIVSETNGSLYDAANRVFGSPPTSGQGGPSVAPAPVMGALSEIDDLLSTLTTAAMTNADQASRFGAL